MDVSCAFHNFVFFDSNIIQIVLLPLSLKSTKYTLILIFRQLDSLYDIILCPIISFQKYV